MEHGLLPSIFDVDRDPKEYLASYVTTYLREEVMQEGLTRNLESFSRALEIASFSQGSTLNISAAAREAQVSRKVMEGYFSIMEDLLLATNVPVFTRRAKRKLINHAKFYFFDVGVYRTLRPMGPFDRAEEAEGAALETLFYEHLRGVNETTFSWDIQSTFGEHKLNMRLTLSSMETRAFLVSKSRGQKQLLLRISVL